MGTPDQLPPRTMSMTISRGLLRQSQAFVLPSSSSALFLRSASSASATASATADQAADKAKASANAGADQAKKYTDQASQTGSKVLNQVSERANSMLGCEWLCLSPSLGSDHLAVRAKEGTAGGRLAAGRTTMASRCEDKEQASKLTEVHTFLFPPPHPPRLRSLPRTHRLQLRGRPGSRKAG